MKKNKNNIHIVAFQLMNDLSGSPYVLSHVIKTLKKKLDVPIDIFIGDDREGFLSGLGVNYFHFPYKRSNYKLVTLFILFFSQFYLILKLLLKYSFASRNIVFYVNTVFPFGAAIAGYLIRRKIIYHIHETTVSPPLFKKFLFYLVKQTSLKNVFVSNYLAKTEGLDSKKDVVLYNTISENIAKKAEKFSYQPRYGGKFNISMICSLKAYKGIQEFIEISKQFEADSNYCFKLVINAKESEIENYFQELAIPKNLEIQKNLTDITLILEETNLLLNLTHTKECIETFGLTILEAFYFGIPCIVPTVGGPTEIVDNEVNGYLISSENVLSIVSKIKELSSSPEKCIELSNNCKIKAQNFSQSIFEKKVIELFKETV